MAEKPVIIQVEKKQFSYITEEKIHTLILQDTDFSSAVVCKISPRTTQSPHYHDRPSDGEELIFVYAGKFELILENERIKFNVQKGGPVFIRVSSKMVASLKNIGLSDVKFFSVFAPTFARGEIKYTNN